MSKRIEIDGKFYRKRRGELVEIPEEWVGKVPSESKKRKRRPDLHRNLGSSPPQHDKKPTQRDTFSESYSPSVDIITNENALDYFEDRKKIRGLTEPQ